MTRRRASAACGVLLVACGLDPVVPVLDPAEAPERIAAAVCHARHDCPCPTATWSDRVTCVEQEIQRLDDAIDIAVETGLLYDPVCGAAILAAYDAAGCDPAPDLDPCAASCRMFVGAGRLGDPCERLGITVDLDTCGPDLRCEDGHCVARCEPPVPLGLGQPCRAGIAELGQCDEGLFCPLDGEGCAPAPVAGQLCVDDVCASSAYCDRSEPEPICVARLEADAACTTASECLSGQCVGTRCEPVAAAACGWEPPV